jgi:hypothetical protein
MLKTDDIARMQMIEMFIARESSARERDRRSALS